MLEDISTFRTLGLRNVALTAPYMHDGSIGTLEGVVEHYNKGGESKKSLNSYTCYLIFYICLAQICGRNQWSIFCLLKGAGAYICRIVILQKSQNIN